MFLSFKDYYHFRMDEMAQAIDDVKLKIELDDEDWDFINQAVAQGISPVSAVRSRYTLLLQDKPGENNVPVRFFSVGRAGIVEKVIKDTHLKHLQDKLRRLNLVHTAAYGLQAREKVEGESEGERYNRIFGRQHAADAIKNGYFFVNEKERGEAKMPGQISAKIILNKVPDDWGDKNVKNLNLSPGYDDVYESLKEIVSPPIYEYFMQNKYIGQLVAKGMKSFLSGKEGGDLIAEDKLHMKQILSQLLAELLVEKLNDVEKLMKTTPGWLVNYGKWQTHAIISREEGHLFRKMGNVRRAFSVAHDPRQLEPYQELEPSAEEERERRLIPRIPHKTRKTKPISSFELEN